MIQNTKNRIAHGIGMLKKWLDTLEIEDYTQLSEQEQATYNQWEQVINKEPNLDELKDFLRKQLVVLSKELREAVEKGEDRRALRISARLDNYEAIVEVLDEPERSREVIIANIKNLITNK